MFFDRTNKILTVYKKLQISTITGSYRLFIATTFYKELNKNYIDMILQVWSYLYQAVMWWIESKKL